MDLTNFTEANRRAWNQATHYHNLAKSERMAKSFKRAGFSTLDRIVTAHIQEIGIAGKRVAQMCCNDGREVLSLRNLGASSAVGFDISDNAIDEARKLAASSSIDAEFVRADIYEIPDRYNGSFDFIYISIGVFGWMPDIDRFFERVCKLIAEGGDILIYEQHPFVEVLDPDERDDPLRIKNPYFSDSPIADDTGFDYWGGVKYRGETSYWFIHTLADIMTALINNGIQIRKFREFSHDIATIWDHIEKTGAKLPLSFILHGKNSGRV